MADDRSARALDVVGRRAVLGSAVAALVALRVGPGRAAAQGRPPALRAEELRALVRWYEALVPGARRAQVGEFVQEQLRVDPPGLALLQLRYSNRPPPFVAFYRGGLAGLDAVSNRRAEVAFAALPADELARLVRDVARGELEGWPDDPPLGLWYSATRADAVDVVYGRQEALMEDDMSMIQVPAPRW